MRAHELARQLLDGPDAPVFVDTEHTRADPYEQWSEPEPVRSIDVKQGPAAYGTAEPVVVISSE